MDEGQVIDRDQRWSQRRRNNVVRPVDDIGSPQTSVDAGSIEVFPQRHRNEGRQRERSSTNPGIGMIASAHRPRHDVGRLVQGRERAEQPLHHRGNS